MKLLNYIVILLGITGCAFNNSPSEINQRENKSIEEKNRVLRSNYNLVTGFYQGQLHLGNDVRTITFGIYTLEVNEGTNSSGEIIFKPVLKAVYRQLYPIEVPIVLDGRFVPETGELSFVNAASGQSIDRLHTINAHYKGSKIVGIAKTPTGILGDLELEFVQKKVEAPTEGDEDYIAEKLRQQYEILTGTYIGKITSPDSPVPGEQAEWDVEIGIYTLEINAGTKPNGETILRPVLKAVFKQRSPVVQNVILDVQYVVETGQLHFVNPNSNRTDLHSINAKLVGKSITGTAKKSSGFWGNLSLDFQAKDVTTDPSGDENEFNRHLREEYEKITGTYRGSVVREASGSEPRREWKVELGLYVIDVKYGTLPSGEFKMRPSLKARFKQLVPVARNVVLDVQWVAESQQLTMSASELPGSPVLIDGMITAGIDSISATLSNSDIKGTTSKGSGYWGELRLKFYDKKVVTPSAGDQEDYNQRLIEEYQPLVGSYTGKVNPRGESLEAFEIELKIFIIQEAGAIGLTPKLKAYYRRVKDRFNATDLTMDVDYKPELSPPSVDMSGQRSNGSMNYFVILNGTFKNKEFYGQFHDQRGNEGPFRVKRR
jgi:hypothetical protein